MASLGPQITGLVVFCCVRLQQAYMDLSGGLEAGTHRPPNPNRLIPEVQPTAFQGLSSLLPFYPALSQTRSQMVTGPGGETTAVDGALSGLSLGQHNCVSPLPTWLPAPGKV